MIENTGQIETSGAIERVQAQDAHRKRWHAGRERMQPKQPRQPEPPPERTFLIRCKVKVDVFLVLAMKRGLLRHLSYLFWRDVFKTFRRWWQAALWVRGAYQYARWRLSPIDDGAAISTKNLTCYECDWIQAVKDAYYCGACICPQKPRADIRHKNQRTYPHCPKGKHPGSTVDPYARMKPCVGCRSKDNGKQ